MPDGVATSSRPTRFLQSAIAASAFATRLALCNGPGDWLQAARARARTSARRRMSRRSSHERVLESPRVGFTARKILHTLFVALGVVTLVFAALRLSGDPAATMLPGDASVDADGSMWRILHPTGFAGKNWVGSQPGHRFHDLMEQARYTLDQEKRKELYTEATRIIHDEKPALERFQAVVIYGVSPSGADGCVPKRVRPRSVSGRAP